MMDAKEKAVLAKSQTINHWSAKKLYYSIGKNHQRNWTVKRGEVYFVDLGENIGSEENKLHPVVILQADAYNFKSPVFTCAIISTSIMTIPDIQVPIVGTYTYIDNKGVSKSLTGTIDLGQIKTIGKERIVSQSICKLSSEMKDVDKKLFNALGIGKIIASKDNTIKSLEGKIEYLNEQLNRLNNKNVE